MKLTRVTPQVNRTLTIAKDHHWKFRALGNVGMIECPIYNNEWWFVPIEQDKSIIPNQAFDRVDAIKDAGIPIKGLIVAHEAPRLLPTPIVPDTPKREIDWQKVGEVGWAIAEVLGRITLALGYIFATAVLVDPALIVVLEDDHWIVVMSWFEL